MLIDFKAYLERKEEKLIRDFAEALARFKDQDTIMEVQQHMVDLERISPDLLVKAHNYVRSLLEEVNKQPPPDIIA